MASKIAFYKENTVNIGLTLTGVDLTGATIYFTVKASSDESTDDSTAIIKKDVTSHTDPTQGVTSIGLTPTDTNVQPGSYIYDIKLKKATGEQTTIQYGKCVIDPVVTNRS